MTRISGEAKPASFARHQDHQEEDGIYVVLRAHEAVVLGLLWIALVERRPYGA
jgi:hypothetical protein